MRPLRTCAEPRRQGRVQRHGALPLTLPPHRRRPQHHAVSRRPERLLLREREVLRQMCRDQLARRSLPKEVEQLGGPLGGSLCGRDRCLQRIFGIANAEPAQNTDGARAFDRFVRSLSITDYGCILG